MKFCPKCETKLKRTDSSLRCPRCDYTDGAGQADPAATVTADATAADATGESAAAATTTAAGTPATTGATPPGTTPDSEFNVFDQTDAKEDEEASLPTVEIHCEKCGNDRAIWWMLQTRSADEPTTRFYRCTKCRRTWRDYT